MLFVARNHYISSIEDSLEHIPEGGGTRPLTRHVTSDGHIDESEVLSWNKGLYVSGEAPAEPYEYIDVGFKYRAPTYRQLTHVGFWRQEGAKEIGKLTFSQWNVIVLQGTVEKIEPPTRYEGSPRAIGLFGLRRIAHMMSRGARLLEAAGAHASPETGALRQPPL